MTDVVWWQIETPAPEACAELCQDLFGWTFEPAFGRTDPGGVSFGRWTPHDRRPGP